MEDNKKTNKNREIFCFSGGFFPLEFFVTVFVSSASIISSHLITDSWIILAKCFRN